MDILLVISKETNDSNAFAKVNELRLQNPKSDLIGHLNVNLLRNNFPSMEELLKGDFDILILSETKIHKKFEIGGYRMFRKDRIEFGGGIMFYVNENIPCRILNADDR